MTIGYVYELHLDAKPRINHNKVMNLTKTS